MFGRSSKKIDDDFATLTSEMQSQTEMKVGNLLEPYRSSERKGEDILLKRYGHLYYLMKGLDELPKGYTSLDASRPWLTFWILNPLELLGDLPLETHSSRVVQFLKNCEDENIGGYGGGPGQLPHLATTYAAINALTVIGTREAYESINRESIYKFLMSMKHPGGGFRMHEDGELDIRGTYCALVVSALLNLRTEELTKNIIKYVISLQSYEGGFSSIGRSEAHGGYTFCGLAILLLMKHTQVKGEKSTTGIDLDRLIHWCVMRQMSYEGGFQGRTNKLVDSCYSFWVGSLFPMLSVLITSQKDTIRKEELSIYKYCDWKCPNEQKIIEEEEEEKKPNSDDDDEIIDLTSPWFSKVGGSWLMDQGALQEYILLACQKERGFVDKPEKYQDYYHTSYSISGLSIAQNNPESPNSVLGKRENLIRTINPIINAPNNKVKKILKHFCDRETL